MRDWWLEELISFLHGHFPSDRLWMGSFTILALMADSPSIPRLIVIDACNISRSSCGPKRESVNCAGLLNVIRWLTVRDFEVNAFLPIIYKNKYNSNVAHVFILNKLHELGVVSFTPARAAHSERPALVNYDDLYVAIMAERHEGVILSGDRFQDVLAKQEYSDLHSVLRDRLNLCFVPTPYDFVEIGVDRLYKKEPAFIIERGGEEEIEERLYAQEGSKGYDKCRDRRLRFTPQVKDRLLESLDELMDELAEREALRSIRIDPMTIVANQDNQLGDIDLEMLDGETLMRIWLSPPL